MRREIAALQRQQRRKQGKGLPHARFGGQGENSPRGTSASSRTNSLANPRSILCLSARNASLRRKRPPPTVPANGNKEEIGESGYQSYANFARRFALEHSSARGQCLCGQ